MDPPNDELALVRDALYGRDRKYVGCFAFNKASERVQQKGAMIFPTVERVLHEEVMPCYPSDPKAQVEQFPGVGNLLVGYFRVVKDGQMERGAGFLSSLSGPVMAEAIRAINIVWDHTIPDSFLSTIEAAARTGSPELQELASWLLDWHHQRPRREKELAASRKETDL